MSLLAEAKLGETTEIFNLESADENRLASLRMVQQASRNIRIFSRDLDQPVYDDAEFVEALRQLAIKSQQSQIRILLVNSDKPVKYGHRLIELSRRLSTAISVRTPDAQMQRFAGAYLVTDRYGYIQRKNAIFFDGVACFYAPMDVKSLAADFDDAWKHSTTCADMRRLHL